VKIIKFLHASNFQLHLPVTCWTPPEPARPFSAAERELADALSGEERSVSFPSSLGEQTAEADLAAPAPVLDGERAVSSGAELSDPEFLNTEHSDAGISEEKLLLEAPDGWLFGGRFPKLPAPVREECLQAVWQSAERVFDIAVAQNVDFVLLTGDILQPDLCGARGFAFLAGQFRRLQERGIPVYWKLERPIEDRMLPDLRFPENVFLFPSHQAHIKKFRLPDSPKNIFIASWEDLCPDFSHYDFSRLPDGKLPPYQTIAVCPNARIFFGTDEESADSAEPDHRLAENGAEHQAGGSGENSKASEGGVRGSTAENFGKLGEELGTRSAFSPQVGEVPYAALTALEERFTLRRSYASGESVLLHSPGPIQHHGPTGRTTDSAPAPAGVTVVQMDLDGDVPVSLQFFPTETIGWRFLEKRIPGEAADWESLSRWMVQTLRREFVRKEQSPQTGDRSGARSGNQAETAAETQAGTQTAPRSGQEAAPDRPEAYLETAEPKNLEAAESQRDGNGQTNGTEISDCGRFFVFWKLTAGKPVHGEMLRCLLEENFLDEERAEKGTALLSELRKAGASLPGRPWTVSIVPERSGLIPFAWGQADTMLGDLLRLAQFHQMNPTGKTRHPDFAPHSLDLSDMLSEEQRATLLREMANLSPGEECSVLEAASILGASALADAQEERNR